MSCNCPPELLYKGDHYSNCRLVKNNSRWHLEFHTTLMSLLRMVRNLRHMDCEHCADLLTQVYKCLDKETQAIRNRSNHDG
jgi:hypothetical protein